MLLPLAGTLPPKYRCTFGVLLLHHQVDPQTPAAIDPPMKRPQHQGVMLGPVAWSELSSYQPDCLNVRVLILTTSPTHWPGPNPLAVEDVLGDPDLLLAAGRLR